MSRKYFITTLLTLICVIALCVFVFARGRPVESEEEAIEVAKAYVLKKYKKDYGGYVINAYDASEIDPVMNGKYWIVSYGIPSVYDENGNVLEATAGGGGPSLKISKQNGKVVYCKLQQ